MGLHIGATIVASCEVTNDAGTLVDPATSMKITITDKFGNVKVNAVDMTKDSTGKYHYDCQTAGYVDGKYIAKYVATDGTRITIEEKDFSLA